MHRLKKPAGICNFLYLINVPAMKNKKINSYENFI